MSPIFKLELVVAGCGIIALLNPADILNPKLRLFLTLILLVAACIWGWNKTLKENRTKKEIVVWTFILLTVSSCLIVSNYQKENHSPVAFSTPTPNRENQTHIKQKTVTNNMTATLFVKETPSQVQPVANNDEKGVTIWFPDTKPIVEFVLGNNPPEINFSFPIGIKNNNDKPQTITLNFEYDKNAFIPALWKIHQTFFYSADGKLGGVIAPPIILVFPKKTELLCYLKLNYQTQESHDKSYYDRLTDLQDKVWVEASISSNNDETSDVQQNFEFREQTLSTFKVKLPGLVDAWGIK